MNFPTGERILATLRRIARSAERHSRSILRRHGLSEPQLAVLRALDNAGPQSPGLVARRVALSPATVTGILDRLERAGLVLRTRSERDRRSLVVALTEEGRARLERSPELRSHELVGRLDELAEAERVALLEALERLAAIYEAMDAPAEDELTSLAAGGDDRVPSPLPPEEELPA